MKPVLLYECNDCHKVTEGLANLVAALHVHTEKCVRVCMRNGDVMYEGEISPGEIRIVYGCPHCHSDEVSILDA